VGSREEIEEESDERGEKLGEKGEEDAPFNFELRLCLPLSKEW